VLAGPITIFTHTSTQSEFFNRFAPQFEADTGVAVEIIEVPFNELVPKALVELTANSGKYDIIAVNSILGWAGMMQFMASLDDLYTPDIEADLSQASIAAATDATGARKAFPFIASIPAMYYRTDIIADRGVTQPTTWDDFVAFCKATTYEPGGGQPKVWGTVVDATEKSTTSATKLLGRFYQAGGGLVDANGDPAIDQEANIEALAWVADLVNVHQVAPPDAAALNYDDAHNLFLQGRAASLLNWQYMVSLASDPAQSQVVDKFTVAPDLTYRAAGENADFWMFAVPEASTKQAAAKEWIRRASQPPQQIDLLATEGLVARLSAMDPTNPDVKRANPFIDAFTQSLFEFGQVAPAWDKMNDVLLRISAAESAAVARVKTPGEALADAQREILGLLA